MIPTLSDIMNLLEELAPRILAEPWDNPGLQVGSNLRKIRKVFLSLDPTIDAVRSAFEEKAQLLLTHHPLIFNSLSGIDYEKYPGNVILEAVKKDICIAAAHTNLDVAEGGINDILAQLLGLVDIEVLGGKESSEGIGIGRVGRLPEPVGFDVLIGKIKERLGSEPIKISGEKKVLINTVAVVGGSGGSFARSALRAGAQMLITGDVSHHHALEAADLGIILIDVGHFSMEKKAFGLFSRRLNSEFKKKGWEVAVQVYDAEKNPVTWG